MGSIPIGGSMEEIICNLCGLSCMLGRKDIPSYGPCGLINAQVCGGYESTPGNGFGALDDLVRHRFSLCEFCLDWLFSKFKVPVVVDDPMNDCLLRDGESLEDGMERLGGFVQLVERHQPLPWRPAADRVIEDEWRKAKKEFFAEEAKRNAARTVK